MKTFIDYLYRIASKFFLPNREEIYKGYQYQMINPPFPMSFREMNKKQSKEYFDWFMSQIPNRVVELTNYVRSDSEYSDWESDFTPNSLNSLGKWFCDHVETRSLTKQEMDEIYNRSPKLFQVVPIPDCELTNSTISLCIDVGIYLSQVIEKNTPGLHWGIGPKPVKSVDYNQPVLKGKGKVDCNPTHLMIVYAYSVTCGSRGPKGLFDLYETWVYVLLNYD